MGCDDRTEYCDAEGGADLPSRVVDGGGHARPGNGNGSYGGGGGCGQCDAGAGTGTEQD
jgi:poly(3-hydroxybutyrate) depolymerase